jgi:galactokinase
MSRDELIQQAAEGFYRTFATDPEFISLAPGRINLIGEHTDYHEGFVFPCATDRAVVVAIGQAQGSSHVVATGFGDCQFHMGPRDLIPQEKWVRYLAGTGSLLIEQGIEVPQFQAYSVSDLPSGAGISSSAASEVAYAKGFLALVGTEMPNVDIARLAQQCENELCGSPCGILDQLASLSGVEGHGLFIDTRNPAQQEPVSIPKDLTLVVCDTGDKHDIGESGYPLRRSQSEKAAQILGVRVLRDATPKIVEAKRQQLGDLLHQRAKHVVTENDRTIAFRNALISGDERALSTLLRQSHESLRDDYEVSTPLLDATAEACWDQKSCIGARMVGGGFGGSCVAIVRKNSADSFRADLESAMARAGATHARVFECQPSSGACCQSFRV